MKSLVILILFMVIFSLFSFLAVRSMVRLNPKFSRYYDFGAFFPKAGRWSIVFYLAIIGLILALVFYFGRSEILKFFPA